MSGFPGGSVVETPPANAVDNGLHPWFRKIPHAPEQLSPGTPQPLNLCSRAQELQLLSLHTPATESCKPYSLCSEAREATAMRRSQLESSPCSPQLEKSLSSSKGLT